MEKGRVILIETRVSYPFIYFLVEENLVLMYRIESDKFVTASTLIESSDTEMYELASTENFESFIHNEREPVEGRSIFMNHRDLDFMTDEINKHIQKNRQLNKDENQIGTVHLVTTESPAGTLRSGLDRPKTVIGFPDSFSIGPLWKLPEKAGLDFRKEWLFDNINFEQENTEYERKFKNALLQIKDIAPHVPIYIWYGNNAQEQTGLRLYLNILRDKPNKIYLMNTTELYEKYIAVEDASAYFHTGLLNLKQLKLFFQKEQKNEPLSEEKRTYYLEEWNALSEKEEVLRIWKNGQIQAVPEDHFDSLIIRKLEKLHQKQKSAEFILTAKVIGEIVAEQREFVDYFYLEFRMRHLVYNGTLEIKGVPKSMRHYQIKLR